MTRTPSSTDDPQPKPSHKLSYAFISGIILGCMIMAVAMIPLFHPNEKPAPAPTQSMHIMPNVSGICVEYDNSHYSNGTWHLGYKYALYNVTSGELEDNEGCKP